MSDPTGPHRPLDASRLHDIVASTLREHRDVAGVALHRSVHADSLGLDVIDHFGHVARIDFVTSVWSRP